MPGIGSLIREISTICATSARPTLANHTLAKKTLANAQFS